MVVLLLIAAPVCQIRGNLNRKSWLEGKGVEVPLFVAPYLLCRYVRLSLMCPPGFKDIGLRDPILSFPKEAVLRKH